MRVEIPEVRRCCCCIPLRYGLLAWGYIKLFIVCAALYAVCVTLLIILTFLTKVPPTDVTAFSLIIILLIIDTISTVIFIVGCHKKNVRLIKIYYFYSIVPLALTTALSVYAMTENLRIAFRYYDLLKFVVCLLLDMTIMFAYIVIQIYILLLIRSEFNKLNNGCQFRFVNNAADSECTLQVKQQDDINATEADNT